MGVGYGWFCLGVRVGGVELAEGWRGGDGGGVLVHLVSRVWRWWVGDWFGVMGVLEVCYRKSPCTQYARVSGYDGSMVICNIGKTPSNSHAPPRDHAVSLLAFRFRTGDGVRHPSRYRSSSIVGAHGGPVPRAVRVTLCEPDCRIRAWLRVYTVERILRRLHVRRTTLT